MFIKNCIEIVNLAELELKTEYIVSYNTLT